MAEPKTWKDFIKTQNGVTNDVITDSMGHQWKRVFTNSPKKKFIIKRVNGYKYAEVTSGPSIIHYTCVKCQISATNYDNNGIKPNSSENQNLKCDQILIRNIVA
jgi:hypothetical protein